MAEGTARGPCHSSDAVQVRAVAAGAGIEAGGADFAVKIPRCAQGSNRGYSAENGGNPKDRGVGRQRHVADFTPGIGTVNKPS